MSTKKNKPNDSDQTKNEDVEVNRSSSEPLLVPDPFPEVHEPSKGPSTGDGTLCTQGIETSEFRKSSSLPTHKTCGTATGLQEDLNSKKILASNNENPETSDIIIDNALEDDAVYKIIQGTNDAELDSISFNEKSSLQVNASTAALLPSPPTSDSALCVRCCHQSSSKPCRNLMKNCAKSTHCERKRMWDECRSNVYTSVSKTKLCTSVQQDDEMHLVTHEPQQHLPSAPKVFHLPLTRSTRSVNVARESRELLVPNSYSLIGPFAGPSGGAIPKSNRSQTKNQLFNTKNRASGNSSSDG